MENKNNEQLKKFLEELQSINKVSLTNSVLQTKYFREIAGEDDDKREKQLDNILKALQGEKVTPEKESTPLEDTKKDIKAILDGFKSVGKGIVSFVKDPKGTSKKAIDVAAGGAEKMVGSIESLFEPGKEKDNEDTAIQGSAKEKIAITKPVSINPEADNIESPQEIIADNAEKSTKLSEELLDTTKDSLKELKLIKEALLAPQPKQETASKQPAAPLLGGEGASGLGLGGVDLNLGGGKQKPALLGGGPGRKPTPGKPPTPQGKPAGMLSKMKGIGGKALGALGGVARAAGPIGAAIAAGSAVYGGVSGAGRANEMFGLEEGKEATTGQKISAGLGGAVSGLTMGLVDEKTVAEGVYGVGKKIGSFFGFGGDGEKTPIEGAPTEETTYSESSKVKTIGGEPYVEGQPLSDNQMAAIAFGHSMGNRFSDNVEKQYENQKLSEKLEDVDKAKYGGPVEARETGGPITQGKAYLVGEEGPEVIIPSKSGKVMPTESKTIDLGGGMIKRVKPDGSYEISGASGTKKYDASGNLVSEVSPRISGYQRETTASGETTDSFSSKTLSADIKRSAAGEIQSSSYSADLGLAKVSSVEAGGKKTMGAEIRTGSDENVMLRDEVAASKTATQPVVMNNVNNTSTNTYIPMKADPRPSHRGSALDNYLGKTSNY